MRKGAKANGFPDERWTYPRIAELIEREYGVRYNSGHVTRLLNSPGWSYPRARDDRAKSVRRRPSHSHRV